MKCRLIICTSQLIFTKTECEICGICIAYGGIEYFETRRFRFFHQELIRIQATKLFCYQSRKFVTVITAACWCTSPWASSLIHTLIFPRLSLVRPRNLAVTSSLMGLVLGYSFRNSVAHHMSCICEPFPSSTISFKILTSTLATFQNLFLNYPPAT
jgi:hypothetical protein